MELKIEGTFLCPLGTMHDENEKFLFNKKRVIQGSRWAEMQGNMLSSTNFSQTISFSPNPGVHLASCEKCDGLTDSCSTGTTCRVLGAQVLNQTYMPEK